MTLDTFTKKLYEKSIDGEWREFASNAEKIGWISHVVHAIEDTAISSLPSADNYSFKKYLQECYGNEEASECYAIRAPYDIDYSYTPRHQDRPA